MPDSDEQLVRTFVDTTRRRIGRFGLWAAVLAIAMVGFGIAGAVLVDTWVLVAALFGGGMLVPVFYLQRRAASLTRPGGALDLLLTAPTEIVAASVEALGPKGEVYLELETRRGGAMLPVTQPDSTRLVQAIRRRARLPVE